jgi:hypothetical protein
MTAPQFFGVLVRAIGVSWLSHGVTYLAAAFAPVQGYTPVVYVLLGAFLMFKADGMVMTCYTLGALNDLESRKPADNSEQA